MDAYKHSAASLTLSLILLVIFKKFQLSISCFLAGIFIDLDHLFDYIINHELQEKISYLIYPKKLARFLSNYYEYGQSVDKLYKPFHSIEFIAFVPILYALGLWGPIAIGITIGFLLHLTMDFIPLGHIGSISLIYKIANGFPTGSKIIKKRLVKHGIDVNRCQICGIKCEVIIHKDRTILCIGFRKKALNKIKVLCEECHHKLHNE